MGGTPDSDDVLTTGQIARLLHCAPRTVGKWIDEGRLPGYRLPGSADRRVLLADLVRFAEANGMQRLLPPQWLTAGGQARYGGWMSAKRRAELSDQNDDEPPPAAPLARAA